MDIDGVGCAYGSRYRSSGELQKPKVRLQTYAAEPLPVLGVLTMQTAYRSHILYVCTSLSVVSLFLFAIFTEGPIWPIVKAKGLVSFMFQTKVEWKRTWTTSKHGRRCLQRRLRLQKSVKKRNHSQALPAVPRLGQTPLVSQNTLPTVKVESQETCSSTETRAPDPLWLNAKLKEGGDVVFWCVVVRFWVCCNARCNALSCVWVLSPKMAGWRPCACGGG